MKKNHETTIKALRNWMQITCKNEDSFIKKFCPDAWMLTEIGWNEGAMKIVYILDGGQHITNSFPIEQWLKWMDQQTKKKAKK